MRPFRQHHLLALFERFEAGYDPFDLTCYLYFKQNRAIGSKDRKEIQQWAVDLIRWRGLLDYFLKENPTWEKRFDLWLNFDLDKAIADQSIPAYIRASVPLLLFERLSNIYGEKRALELSCLFNERAPVTLRANLLKTTRDELLEQLSSKFAVIPTEKSPCGITLIESARFRDLPEFQQGLFEVQDEGSQLLAQLVQAKPGQLFIDFCAGSGGKSLAIAPQMEGKGQIFYHDIRKRALSEAKQRFKRAGIQNAQPLEPESNQWKKLKRKADWVLVDAPCSGTGTLRRQIELKWRIDEQFLKELRAKQRTIFERALQFIKPGGSIVYATCSILPEENEEQLEHFLKTYPVTLAEEPFKTLPISGGMDGFFAARLLL